MSLLRRLAEMVGVRGAAPNDERSTQAVRLEELRSEAKVTLDRVDRIVPPKHPRFASYQRVRLGR